MKKLKKMTAQEVLYFVLMSVCSGLMIGIGGAASLLANSLFSTYGRLIGACMFSIAIFAIVTFEMRLFTGMVAGIPKMGLKNTWQLPVCFFGNVLGVAILATLLYFSPIADKIIPQAQALIGGKLEADAWAGKALCSSILCGALITLSVWSFKYAPKKNLSATVGVLFPIIVFAFCGFDHSVANMLYFIFLGKISWQIVGYCAICIVGNIIGGLILPLISLLREKNDEKRNG